MRVRCTVKYQVHIKITFALIIYGYKVRELLFNRNDKITNDAETKKNIERAKEYVFILGLPTTERNIK